MLQNTGLATRADIDASLEKIENQLQALDAEILEARRHRLHVTPKKRSSRSDTTLSRENNVSSHPSAATFRESVRGVWTCRGNCSWQLPEPSTTTSFSRCHRQKKELPHHAERVEDHHPRREEPRPTSCSPEVVDQPSPGKVSLRHDEKLDTTSYHIEQPDPQSNVKRRSIATVTGAAIHQEKGTDGPHVSTPKSSNSGGSSYTPKIMYRNKYLSVGRNWLSAEEQLSSETLPKADSNEKSWRESVYLEPQGDPRNDALSSRTATMKEIAVPQENAGRLHSPSSQWKNFYRPDLFHGHGATPSAQ